MKLKYHIIIAALITLLSSCVNPTPVPISVTYRDKAGNVYNYTEEKGLEIQIEDAK